jgi:hypothetical protein
VVADRRWGKIQIYEVEGVRGFRTGNLALEME